MVFFEAPHRVGTLLAAMVESFGPDPPAAVCRELTKTYEEVRRGTLAELAQWATGEVRGEIVVVVGGAQRPAGGGDLTALVAEVRARVDAGERLKDAARAVAAAAGVPTRTLYEAALPSAGARTTS